MRVSVIPEQAHGVCSSCHLPGLLTQYTIAVGLGVETSEPLCVGCLRSTGEVAIDVQQPVMPAGGPPSRRVKQASRRNERHIAVGIDGREQPGSGNQPGAKGDVRKRGEFRVEAKDSYSNQFILRKAVLDKIRGECGAGERPALVLTFMEKHTFRPRERWAIIPYEHWEETANGTSEHR